MSEIKQNQFKMDGRLYLPTGINISNFLEYVGSIISYWNGKDWEYCSFSKLYVYTNQKSNTNYDIFVGRGASIISVEWNNSLWIKIKNLWWKFCKNYFVDFQKRKIKLFKAGIGQHLVSKMGDDFFTYVGTARTDKNGYFVNYPAKRYVFNLYNRKIIKYNVS